MDLDRYKLFGESLANMFVAAAANADLAAMKALLVQGANLDAKEENRYGRTALHSASSQGIKSVVSFLIEKGANLNPLDINSMTPLMCACSKGKKKGSDVALLLLNAGADVQYVRKGDGMTALKFAVRGQCSPEVIQGLLNCGAKTP